MQKGQRWLLIAGIFLFCIVLIAFILIFQPFQRESKPSENQAPTANQSAQLDFSSADAVLERPKLLFPLTTSNAASTSPTFYWEESAGAETYQFNLQGVEENVYTMDITRQLPASICSSGLCTYAFPYSLEANFPYTWYVTANNGSGEEINSYFKEFTIKYLTQQQPVLVYPTNHKEITIGTTLLKWRPVDNAVYYEIELYRPNGTKYDIFQITNDVCTMPTSCEYKLPNYLEKEYGTYEWRVRALSNPVFNPSQWSEKATFDYIPLDTLVLLSPTNLSSTQNNRPTFTWEISSATVFKYEIQLYNIKGELIAADTILPTDDCNDATCSWTPDNSLPAGDYKWRVLAKKYPNTSPWSGTWLFTIE